MELPRSRATAALVLFTAASALSGCALTANLPGPPPVIPSPSQTTTSTLEQIEAANPEDAAACESLVGPSVLPEFRAIPEVRLFTADQIETDFGFLGFSSGDFDDGLMCRWGYPYTDVLIDFFWAPIDAERAAQIREQLVAESVPSVSVAEGELFTRPPDHFEQISEYLFGDGYWVYVYAPDPTAVEIAHRARTS